MNWTFKSVPMPVPGVREFIGLYRDLLAEGIEAWLACKPETEKQPETDFAEFPEGFYRDEAVHPVAYRYTTSVGFYHKGKYYRMGQVPYNIIIERATPADYDHEHGLEGEFAKRIRVRYIDNVAPIS